VYLVIAAVAVVAACGGESGSAQGPSAEELTAWAQSLDEAGADLEPASITYVAVVGSVGDAAEKNVADLAKWDKEWKKRQAAYEKEVAAVEAYNASERQKAAANPTWIMILPPTQRLVHDPSTGKTVVVGVKGPSSRTIQGYQPQYRSLPPTAKMPKRVKVKLADEIKRLKKLDARLGDLEARLAALVVGAEFAGVLTEMQAATTDLHKSVVEARKALKKAVKKDKKRGDVIVTKRVQGLEAGDLAARLSALREALRAAAEVAGVAAALTWVSPGAAASPPSSASGSPSS
jgi:hypothetical protein